MADASYTHEQMSAILEQFRLVPKQMQADFLAKVSADPEISGNPNRLAASMQGVINQAAELAQPQTSPFAALLSNVGLSKELLALNAPNAPASAAPMLQVPGQKRDTRGNGLG